MSDKKKPLASISTQTIDAKQGKLGVITLDSPKTLNSLTLDMVREIRSKLEIWCNDDDIAVIVIRGSGEKAFCAGGDVQKLYQSAIEQPGGPCEYAETFFFDDFLGMIAAAEVTIYFFGCHGDLPAWAYIRALPQAL